MTSSDKPEPSEGHPDKQDADQTTRQNSQHTSVMTGEPAAGEDAAQGSTGAGTEDAGSADAGGADASSADSSREGSGGETSIDSTETPPPWQRGAASSPSSGFGSSSTAGGPGQSTASQPSPEADTVRTEIPTHGADAGGRTAVNFGASARPGAQTTGARRPSRGPRRASLQVKRLDPWSVLKLALVLSVAMFFVWMIAIAVLYGVLDGMGVWDSLNGTFTELTQPENAANEVISAGRVFGVASIIGAINIVLFTALATVSAFIYNVAADFAGGVEVTLSERE